MNRNIQYILVFLLIGFYGCESYYNPEIEQFPAALVVEGMLTDQNDFVSIKLTNSAAFNDKSFFFSETKASVSVKSESGKSYPATEIERGVYQTNEPVPAEVGEGYFVEIITSKGVKYRSKIEKMMSPTPIDSIYLTDSILRDITYNYYGEPKVNSYGGITFSVVPREPTEAEVGFLYKWNGLLNYYVISNNKGIDQNYYCWRQLNSTSIYVYNYVHNNFVNELPLGDLLSIPLIAPSSFSVDTSLFKGVITHVLRTSFYFHLRQYTITKEGSKFWRSVKNQSEASGKLFDPLEEQIIGNIYCVSDTSKVAFGYFNTASFSDKVIGIKLLHDKHGDVKKVDLMPFIQAEEGCFLNSVPDFWY